MVDGRAHTIVDLLVGPEGNAICTKTLTPSNTMFGGGTEKALTGWTFAPAFRGGKPAAVSKVVIRRNIGKKIDSPLGMAGCRQSLSMRNPHSD